MPVWDGTYQWITGDAVAVAPIELSGAKQYRDARSAAFFAMGTAVKSSQSVTLVVSGHDLPSTYTAITEAWFQKANVIVVVLFEKVSEVKTAWMDRCVLRTATFGVDEQDSFGEMIEAVRGISGPVLINLTGFQLEDKAVDYDAAVRALYAVEPNVKMMGYNPKTQEGSKINAISVRNKYGIISKYIGMSVAKNVGVLLCPASCALLDMNIFRTRYTNSNMKIILLDEDGILDALCVDQWITDNNWDYLETDGAEDAGAEWLLSRKRQAVWMIR